MLVGGQTSAAVLGPGLLLLRPAVHPVLRDGRADHRHRLRHRPPGPQADRACRGRQGPPPPPPHAPRPRPAAQRRHPLALDRACCRCSCSTPCTPARATPWCRRGGRAGPGPAHVLPPRHPAGPARGGGRGGAPAAQQLAAADAEPWATTAPTGAPEPSDGRPDPSADVPSAPDLLPSSGPPRLRFDSQAARGAPARLQRRAARHHTSMSDSTSRTRATKPPPSRAARAADARRLPRGNATPVSDGATDRDGLRRRDQPGLRQRHGPRLRARPHPGVMVGIGWLVDRARRHRAALHHHLLSVLGFAGISVKLLLGYDLEMRKHEDGAIWNRATTARHEAVVSADRPAQRRSCPCHRPRPRPRPRAGRSPATSSKHGAHGPPRRPPARLHRLGHRRRRLGRLRLRPRSSSTSGWPPPCSAGPPASRSACSWASACSASWSAWRSSPSPCSLVRRPAVGGRRAARRHARRDPPRPPVLGDQVRFRIPGLPRPQAFL